MSFPFSISVHDFCRSEARYRIIVAFLRLKYVLVEIGIIFLLIKILFTLVVLQKSMKESVDNLKIQHMCDWFQFLKIVLEIFKFLCSIHTSYSWNMIWNVCACFSVEKKENTYSPSQSSPTILKNWASCFFKIGRFLKKTECN